MVSDPIVALATASGRSALAVVRLSGAGAFEVARQVLRWPAERAIVPRRMVVAPVFETEGHPVDRALVTFFPGPASYTGEDLVEISCHGGLLVPAQVVIALMACGARAAAPGEFTRRAVVNGRLDLIQAEAVGDLIDATTRAQGRAAAHQLDGGLSKRLQGLRASCLDLLAMLAYDIDFPEEDDGPVSRAHLEAALDRVTHSIERLLVTAPVGARLQRGAMVVFAGRPNAGKSSLFNGLLGIERALVTEIAGTTRDAIEAAADVDGWPVRFIDTAGLRSSEDRIELLGIEMSRRYLAAADLVLLCVEAGRTLTAEENALVEGRPALLVRTKADLTEEASDSGIPVSVIDGRGFDQIRKELVARLFATGDASGEIEPLLTRERHRLGLERGLAALGQARLHLADGGEPVLVAHHVQDAVGALDELVGAVDFEEVLGRLFERFCVGK